jgi:hypothetical protein
MSKRCAVELAEHLAAMNWGTAGTDLFADAMPDAPDECISVASYNSGETPMRIQSNLGISIEAHHVQVRVRAASHDRASTQADGVIDELSRINNQAVGDHLFVSVWPMQPPFPLSEDEQRRTVYAFNLRVLRKP